MFAGPVLLFGVKLSLPTEVLRRSLITKSYHDEWLTIDESHTIKALLHRLVCGSDQVRIGYFGGKSAGVVSGGTQT